MERLLNIRKEIKITHQIKWKLSVDFIIIVGKYFESLDDYIHLMKLCSKYNQFFLFYRYNPISDTRLFKLMQTQHFYKHDDIKNKKEGMTRYIDWNIVNHVNSIGKTIYVRDPYIHIMYNIPLLQTWNQK